MLVGKLEEVAKACEIKDELVKNLQQELDEAKEESACVQSSLEESRSMVKEAEGALVSTRSELLEVR